MNEERKKELESGRKNLLEKLSVYGAQEARNPLAFEKMTYDAPSDAELENLAKEFYAGDALGEKERAYETVANEKKKAKESLDDTVKSFESIKKESEDVYDTALKSIENQALKRGIARSSIAVGAVKDLEDKKIKALESIDEDEREKIKSINDQIDLLESDLAVNLAKIDDKYATAIKNKLDSLKEERQNRIDEVLKYNNQLTELNAKYAPLKDGEVDPLDRKRVSEVATYYLGFSDPVEALADFLSEEKFKDYLGNRYDTVYKMLLNPVNALKKG